MMAVDRDGVLRGVVTIDQVRARARSGPPGLRRGRRFL